MSQFFQVHPENPQARLIKQAVEIIRQGGVVVFPTESSYAVACHIGDKTAVERIRRLRRLDDTLPYALSVLYEVLAGDGTARLQKNWVRQKPLAVAVGADYDMLSRADNLFVLMGYPAKGVGTSQLQAALQSEIAAIARAGITPAELQRV